MADKEKTSLPGQMGERLVNGLIKENPTFVLLLGMCPTLATTTSAINGLGMGLTTMVVLAMSNMIISALRKIIPNKIRIPAFIVIIASFVTIVELLLEAYIPSLYDSLGIYIPLIVVNCIILGRAEAYAYSHPVIPSLFDGIGMGLGFTMALTLIGAFRELLGSGAIFGTTIMPSSYEPIRIFIMAPGAFFVLAALTAIQNAIKAAGTKRGKDMSKIQSGCGGNCMDCSKECKADPDKPVLKEAAPKAEDQKKEEKKAVEKPEKKAKEKSEDKKEKSAKKSFFKKADKEEKKGKEVSEADTASKEAASLTGAKAGEVKAEEEVKEEKTSGSKPEETNTLVSPVQEEAKTPEAAREEDQKSTEEAVEVPETKASLEATEETTTKPVEMPDVATEIKETPEDSVEEKPEKVSENVTDQTEKELEAGEKEASQEAPVADSGDDFEEIILEDKPLKKPDPNKNGHRKHGNKNKAMMMLSKAEESLKEEENND